jgi:hypothetical protein
MDALHRSAHGSCNFVTPSSNSSVQLFIPYPPTSFVGNHFYHIPDCQSSDTSDVKASGCDVISEAVASFEERIHIHSAGVQTLLIQLSTPHSATSFVDKSLFIKFRFAKFQTLLM